MDRIQARNERNEKEYYKSMMTSAECQRNVQVKLSGLFLSVCEIEKTSAQMKQKLTKM